MFISFPFPRGPRGWLGAAGAQGGGAAGAYQPCAGPTRPGSAGRPLKRACLGNITLSESNGALTPMGRNQLEVTQEIAASSRNYLPLLIDMREEPGPPFRQRADRPPCHGPGCGPGSIPT